MGELLLFNSGHVNSQKREGSAGNLLSLVSRKFSAALLEVVLFWQSERGLWTGVDIVRCEIEYLFRLRFRLIGLINIK